MIICNSSNIDIIQGNISYGNAVEGITDWRLENTNTGVFNILNSTSTTANISIIDNGNIGIGTVPITSSSILEIIGDINISGNYRKNNIDFISDTSNYVLSTSNILSTNIENSISQWISNNNNMIYYTPLSNPITSSPAATTTYIIGNCTYIQFTYTTETAGTGTGQSLYTITVPTGGVMCDILIVGGGGGGGTNAGAGGGAGGLILLENTILSAGTITIKVGNGGDGGTTSAVGTVASNGKDTIFGTNTAIGGGAGVNSGGANGNAGGSGGGAGNDGTGNRTGGAGTTGQGFKGGNGTIPGGTERTGGGGGGAGGEGQASVSSSRAGDGGIGRNMSSIFGTSVGHAGWFAGGGGGGVHSGTGGTGGNGGGGSEDIQGTNGTGGGGGAGRSPNNGKRGGSGIVIIRYLTSTKNVGIGIANPTSKLHLYDNTINETKLTIQNSFSLLPDIITSSPTATTTGIVGTDRYMSFTYTTDNVSGLVGQTQYTFSTTEPLICDILVIGGGGIGGAQASSGGGGAGTLLYHKNIYVNGNYTVNVGRGCVDNENTGYSSKFINNNGTQEYLAIGGGRAGYPGVVISNGGQAYGTMNIYLPADNKFNGTTVNVLNNEYVNTLTSPEGCRGNMGGERRIRPGSSSAIFSGGGGGAGGRGEDGNTCYGGIGLAIDITGTSVVYAGGGTGGQSGGGGVNIRFNPLYPTIESRGGGGYGSDVGGNGLASIGQNGLNGTGGGGGGACSGAKGGNGGSGIVIMRYRKLSSSSIDLINSGNINYIEPIIPGTTVAVIPGTLYKYILFPYTITTSGLTGQTQYIFTAIENINCEILVVAGGGGGGGSIGGGGGAGAVVYIPSATLSAGSYTIRVGNGGIGSTGGASANGVLSSLSGSFGTITAEGGGGVTGGHDTGDGSIGGSGGGAAGPNQVLNYGGAAGTSSSLGGFTGFIYGNRGGNNTTTRTGGPTHASGGGGAGSAAADTNPNGTVGGGNGGAGILINITGNNNYYGGGGGGAGHGATGGSGGIGGGGNGVREDRVGYSGAPNTGGGGGGGGWSGYSGGSGGSGVVIIRYLITKNLTTNTTNYKIGNYNGDFIVKSLLNGSDIDYIKITGAITTITNPIGTTTWTTASDRRIKENIERASYDKCYESINKLELNRFNYINGFNTVNRDITQLGFIAQEVKEIFPKSVFENSYINNNINISDLQSIDITQINYTLYGAVKKLIEIINDDEEKIKKLESILKIDIDKMLTSNIDIDNTLTSNIDIDSISIITK